MRKLKYGASIAAIAVIAGGLHYALPKVTVARIIQTEVKRVDAEGATRDVYQIQAEEVEGENVRVFRNEDNLFYFKFNSADMQATASNMSRGDEQPTVAIRHYGWRIPVLSAFPNAVHVWDVEPDYHHFPLFNLSVIALLIGFGAYLRYRVRRMFSGRTSRNGSGVDAAPTLPDENGDADWLGREERRGPGSDEADPDA